MPINHRFASLAFAFAAGLLASFCSYQWVTDPDRGARRALEERVVREARLVLTDYVSNGQRLEISDPLERIREAGKVYIYPATYGWELSGQYRRDGENEWHAFLMQLDGDAGLISLAVDDDDPALRARADADPKFSASR